MERVNSILKHPIYKVCIEKIEAAEKNRLFCRHNISHFLDVARLAMIHKQEQKIEMDTEIIYAAALLHDIGRHIQYEKGTPHEEASAQIAPTILQESGFLESEIDRIIEAIRAHRDSEVAGNKKLSGLLYDADKMSRPCYFCPVEKECNWGKKKKNLELIY